MLRSRTPRRLHTDAGHGIRPEPPLTDDLGRPAPGLGEAVERLVRDWEEFVLELVRTEGASKRTERGWRRMASMAPGWS